MSTAKLYILSSKREWICIVCMYNVHNVIISSMVYRQPLKIEKKNNTLLILRPFNAGNFFGKMKENKQDKITLFSLK